MANCVNQNADRVLVDNWKREQILGSGGFGVVSLWLNVVTNERIALKQCRFSQESAMSAKYKERWKQEVDIMSRLECAHVVRAIAVPPALDSANSDLPILGMEYCSGGDLRKVLNEPHNCCGLREPQIRQILKQVSSAIEYLHSKRIIHRDLKPENVVLQPLSDGKIVYKLIDLGYAKELDQSSLCSSFVGTLQYLAPELFLSKQYSSSVDNWSFGLLAHETITGRRPFLPHLSPAQWIPLVTQKSSSDICAYQDSDGKVIFSRELSQFNQICSALKFNLENWLRMVLEWDAKKRGAKFAFQLLEEILNKPMVQLFVINSLENFSYEITEDTKLADLKLLIHSNTGINCDNQHLILPRGVIPVEDIGQQILNNWYKKENNEDNNPITIIVFDNSKVADYNPYSACIIPPAVEEIMLNPTEMMAFEEQKNAWKTSFWVAMQAIKKYRHLHDGFKNILMNCLSLQNVMQKLTSKVNVEFSKLVAVAQFFKSSIKFNLEQFDKYKVSSSLLRSSKEALIELREVYSMQETIAQLFTQSHDIATKVIDSQRTPQFNSFLKSNSVDESLSNIYSDILLAYDQLRKRPKEERNRKTNNTHMVKLLCDCFQLEEKLMKDIYSNLRKLIQLILQIETHNRDLELILSSVTKSQLKLNSLQDKIQNEMWNFLELRLRDSEVNCSSRNSLSSSINSDELVTENESLMKSIDSIISRIQNLNIPTDYSFLHT